MAIHFTLQGKGGVGKSFIAALLAQYYQQKGQSIQCIDTDPVNATLQGYKAFTTHRIELMEDTRINDRKFDEMMEALLNGEASQFIVDNGAASFIALSGYLIENQAIDMLAAADKRVVIHTVITGGQALMDTLAGFSRLAEHMPPTAQMVVWLNEFFGEITVDGKSFEDMKTYQQHRDRVTGLVRIPKQNSTTFSKDIEWMLDRKLTFAEMDQSPDVGVMTKQRLRMVQRALFDQLDAVL